MPCTAPVTLRLRADERTKGVYLRLWWNDREQVLPMDATKDGLWTITMPMPDRPGTLWYHFIAETENGVFWYGNAHDGMGGEGEIYSHEPPGYQITIYEQSYETPKWMRDGVMYQIMVDRFFEGKPRNKKQAPQDGWLHEDWYEPPTLRLDGADNEANDFFGGDLKGIQKKLRYLRDMGVTVIYMNPIFRARSNHKYDTGDFMQVDPSFGTEEDLTALCDAAREMGIRVILDGVFSHTGADSRYFNIKGTYDSVGAYQSKDSPYADWYTFKDWPDTYESWWGFPMLPEVREMQGSYLDYIIRDEDSVSAHYLNAGTSGWRLDVADELPMAFLRILRQRVKEVNPDACLLGEVWEDASNKISYGKLRSYCVGDTLDSVMNYPLRDLAQGFMLGTVDAAGFVRKYQSLQENYAPMFFYSLMNLLGSHDKPRIIDILSGEQNLEPARPERHARTLPPIQYELGKRRYIALWRFICALPGMPCIYYADEAGQTGMGDPFCRGTYPWGREDAQLLRDIKAITRQRRSVDALRTGEIRWYAPSPDVLVVARRIQGGKDVFGDEAENGLAACAINRSEAEAKVRIPADDFLTKGFTCALKGISAVTRLFKAE